MDQIELRAEKRTVIGKHVQKLRRAGLVPGIIYGHETAPVPFQVEARALGVVLRKAGTNRLIGIRLPGEDNPRMVLAREIQRDVLSHAIIHVDLQQVVMTEKIRTEVPLDFEGESPLVKQGIGILNMALDAVEIEALPGDLISSIRVDISGLDDFDKAIHVGDLGVPPAVTILSDAAELVANLVPVAAEEEVPVEVPTAEEPEVISAAEAQRRRAEREAQGAE